jgi:hypothetical protein
MGFLSGSNNACLRYLSETVPITCSAQTPWVFFFWTGTDGLHGAPHVAFGRSEIPSRRQKSVGGNTTAVVNALRRSFAAIRHDRFPDFVSISLDHISLDHGMGGAEFVRSFNALCQSFWPSLRNPPHLPVSGFSNTFLRPFFISETYSRCRHPTTTSTMWKL